MFLALRVLMRTVHVVAASAWIGGSIFYLVALIPALRSGGPAPRVAAEVAGHFRQLVNVCMGLLLLSGVYLTADRLTTTSLGLAYVVVLGVKIAVALALFGLAIYQAQEGVSRLRRERTRLWKAVPRLILGLGLVAFLLGALLTALFEG